MSKPTSILILICCQALALSSCGPAPDPAEDPAPAIEEIAAEEALPSHTLLPPTEENDPADEDAPLASMTLSSPAFSPGEAIPRQFSCDGDDLSPELVWGGIPASAASLVLVLDDPDVPMGTWDHWILFDIPPDLVGLPQGGSAGSEGNNSWNQTGYRGPCPPSGTHRYFFRLSALDTILDLPAGTPKGVLEAAMEGHILGQAELMGTYTR